MKKEEDKMWTMILKSLDGLTTRSEEDQLREAFRHDPALGMQYEEMARIRAALQAYEVPDADRWSNREIDHILARAKSSGDAAIFTLARHWQKIAAACLLAILINLGSIYMQSGKLDTDTLVGVDEIEADEAYTYLNTNYSYNE